VLVNVREARSEEIKHHNEEVRQNRDILMTITSTNAVLYLGKQEMPFRGHDESSDSLDKGNYMELCLNVLQNLIQSLTLMRQQYSFVYLLCSLCSPWIESCFKSSCIIYIPC
jgi:hypothetical protein